MGKTIISKNYFYDKARDRIGGTFTTDVYKMEDGLFRAYSHYLQDEDEEIVGFAESYDDERAVMLSRKDLRKEWKDYLEEKAAGIERKSDFTIYLANGEVITSN